MQLIAVKYSALNLQPGSILKVTFTVRNDGPDVANTQGPQPGFVYTDPDDYHNKGNEDSKGAWRVALSYVGVDRNRFSDHPYRWGLGIPLQPGEQRDIIGNVIVSQTKEWFAGLVQERVKWAVVETNHITIKVEGSTPPPPTSDLESRVSALESWQAKIRNS